MGLGALIVVLGKIIVLCFAYAFICEGIDVLKWFITCLTVDKYNYYTAKFQRKVEERLVVPYQKNLSSTGETIDISSLIEVTPKLVAKIDVMTGRVQKKEVWKKRGICERFVHPWSQGMAKATTTKAETEIVEKTFVYVQSLVNTLNLCYPNWKELNPELAKVLQNERIVAEEVIISHLCCFRH